MFDSEKKRWIPGWENPFVFYDEDRDQLSEVVVRFSGKGDQVESMRYSLMRTMMRNAAILTTMTSASLVLHRAKMTTEERYRCLRSLTEKITLRGYPADPVLSWRSARAFGEKADWGRVLMAWVENNNNIDSRPDERSRIAGGRA